MKWDCGKVMKAALIDLCDKKLRNWMVEWDYGELFRQQYARKVLQRFGFCSSCNHDWFISYISLYKLFCATRNQLRNIFYDWHTALAGYVHRFQFVIEWANQLNVVSQFQLSCLQSGKCSNVHQVRNYVWNRKSNTSSALFCLYFVPGGSRNRRFQQQ